MGLICKIIGVIICLAILLNCDGHGRVRLQLTLPKNLNEAILKLKQILSKAELEGFKKLPEEKAVAEQHFQLGLWIRNTWIRGDRDTALTNYFNLLGVQSADDMSSIILTSLHRDLNHQPLDLNKQVEGYKAYWAPIIECDRKQKEIAVMIYRKFKVGNKVTISMPVYVREDSSRNAIIYECPSVDWIFNPGKDLLMKGEIVEKYVINSQRNVFFKVKVSYMNNRNTQVFGQDVKIGDNIDFSLIGLKVE